MLQLDATLVIYLNSCDSDRLLWLNSVREEIVKLNP